MDTNEGEEYWPSHTDSAGGDNIKITQDKGETNQDDESWHNFVVRTSARVSAVVSFHRF